MSARPELVRWSFLLTTLWLAACADFAPTRPPVARTRTPTLPAPAKDSAPNPADIPPNLADIPDAVPVNVPKSKSGNPDSYEALGETYVVQKEPPPKGYVESGRASWYGNKFHGRKTASGERYNMFAMTAAHKTLQLPSFARVTNLDNGKSCVVKVNDRGPFVKGRIVDVSYAAAARLDMLKTGHANVSLEVLTPDEGSGETTVAETAPRYLQAGTFADPVDAVALQDQLARLDLTSCELLQVPTAAGDAMDVILRIGPFRSFAALEKVRLKLQKNGIAAIPTIE